MYRRDKKEEEEGRIMSCYVYNQITEFSFFDNQKFIPVVFRFSPENCDQFRFAYNYLILYTQDKLF